MKNWVKGFINDFLVLFSFTLKQKGKEDDEAQISEVTVYDYFVNHRNIELRYSGDLPCINVGKPKRPTYFPLEVKTSNPYLFA